MRQVRKVESPGAGDVRHRELVQVRRNDRLLLYSMLGVVLLTSLVVGYTVLVQPPEAEVLFEEINFPSRKQPTHEIAAPVDDKARAKSGTETAPKAESGDAQISEEPPPSETAEAAPETHASEGEPKPTAEAASVAKPPEQVETQPESKPAEAEAPKPPPTPEVEPPETP